MTTVRVLPSGVEVSVGPGETLFDAAIREGWRWPTNCYGQCQCTACHVTIVEGTEYLESPGDEERAILRRLSRFSYSSAPAAVRRLACQTRPLGNLIVELRTALTPIE